MKKIKKYFLCHRFALTSADTISLAPLGKTCSFPKLMSIGRTSAGCLMCVMKYEIPRLGIVTA